MKVEQDFDLESTMLPVIKQSHNSETNMKRVSFHGRVTVCSIPTISGLTETQRACMWYSERELANSREEQRYTLELLIQGLDIVDHDNDHCADGLRTPCEQDQRRLAMSEALEQVLAEQDLQFEEGENDPEILADLYFECTWHSQCLALDRGRKHAGVVAELTQCDLR